MANNLELMLDGPVEQPLWLPRAYSDLIMTYRHFDRDDVPTRLFIYHDDSVGGIATYTFLANGWELPMQPCKNHLSVTHEFQHEMIITILRGSTDNPLGKHKLLTRCQELEMDAIYSPAVKRPDTNSSSNFSSFAMLYFAYTFFESQVGVDIAAQRMQHVPEGAHALPVKHYDSRPKVSSGDNVIQLPRGKKDD